MKKSNFWLFVALVSLIPTSIWSANFANPSFFSDEIPHYTQIGDYENIVINKKRGNHFYKVEVPKGWTLSVSIKVLNDAGHLKLSILDKKGDDELSFSNSHLPEQSITVADLKDKKYIIKVKSKNSQDLYYSLSIKMEPGCGTAKWPEQWQDLEIEAKWNTKLKVYHQMIEDLKDGIQKYGYTLEVRWNGIPRRFIDVYFDNDKSLLTKIGHALRHRTQYSARPQPKSYNLADLELARRWRPNWSRMQYKSTPIRVGAVWFRKESGDCLTWVRNANRADDTTDFCYSADFMPNAYQLLGTEQMVVDSADSNDNSNDAAPAVVVPDFGNTHPALLALKADHPDMDLTTLEPVLVVKDYRYRVVFKEGDVSLYEMSLDRLITMNLMTDTMADDLEIELEVIKEGYTKDDLLGLLKLAHDIKKDYKMKASQNSKGGNYINDVCTEK